MNPEHKRIVELANGWGEDSEAVVSLSPADAKLLESVGAKVTKGKRPGDACTIVAKDLYAAAQTLQESFHETPEGAQPTPNQQSVTGPGTDPDPNRTNAEGPEGPTGSPGVNGVVGATADADLDGLTVAELKDVAASEGIDITAHGKKAEIIAAIRKARAGK
jgi:hypothetical protein